MIKREKGMFTISLETLHMLNLRLDLAHSMFNDGYSPHTRRGEETFGHRADDTSFCFVVYPGVTFCVCGQTELLTLTLLGVSLLVK